MPELAEVEYFRRLWDAGIGHRILKVALHARKRVFRDTNARELRKRLTGERFLGSEARGKRMLFKFSADNCLGLHLGMAGRMSVAPADFQPDRHDHLVLYQHERALVFRDARQFGRVQFFHGKELPPWWTTHVPEIVSGDFTRRFFDRFLNRHGKARIKAVLLLQTGFSGIGNWMADEILWRAKVAPYRRTGDLNANQRAAVFRATRFVARQSLRFFGENDSDLPKTWLIHERWSAEGTCPRHRILLRRAPIGGRTTAWCPKCQR